MSTVCSTVVYKKSWNDQTQPKHRHDSIYVLISMLRDSAQSRIDAHALNQSYMLCKCLRVSVYVRNTME